MRIIKKVLIWIGATISMLYLLVIGWFYFNQQNLIFFPKKLPTDFVYTFEIPHEEMFFQMVDSVSLNAVLFKTDSARGLVFYLHGNAGAMDTWGRVANVFVDNGYDCLVLDYRGYGKSEGAIASDEQLYADVKRVYDQMLNRYIESNMIIVGYSIGTGPAAQLASNNQPKRLILQAPYDNMAAVLNFHYPFLPSSLLEFRLTTDQFVEQTNAPITIFHGDQDLIIPYACSERLSNYFSEGDELIKLTEMGHSGFTKNKDYLNKMGQVLAD